MYYVGLNISNECKMGAAAGEFVYIREILHFTEIGFSKNLLEITFLFKDKGNFQVGFFFLDFRFDFLKVGL